jgi:hypothetical protein
MEGKDEFDAINIPKLKKIGCLFDCFGEINP